MTSIVRAALIALIAAFAIPANAAAQRSRPDSLLLRIDLLERRVAGLEQRVLDLEAVINAQTSRVQPAHATALWRNLANWRRLQRGMSMDQVRALLGEPHRVETIAIATTWYWGDAPETADVVFDDRGRLAAWSEPSQ